MTFDVWMGKKPRHQRPIFSVDRAGRDVEVTVKIWHTWYVFTVSLRAARKFSKELQAAVEGGK